MSDQFLQERDNITYMLTDSPMPYWFQYNDFFLCYFLFLPTMFPDISTFFPNICCTYPIYTRMRYNDPSTQSLRWLNSLSSVDNKVWK